MLRYGYEEMLAQIHAGRYACFSIGRTRMGREIPALRIGEGRLPLLIVGAHHGREYISSRFIMRELEGIALPDEVTLYAVPMLNPDGVELSLTACPSWKANSAGVDLNENYPCLFFEKKSAPAPCSEGFKGYYPASEPEVRALMDFCESVRPFAALTFHAKGEEIYFADENTPEVTAYAQGMASELARLSGYRLMDVSREARIYAAGFENWFRERFLRPCLLIELAPYDGNSMPYPVSEFDALTQRARGMTAAFARYAAKDGKYVNKW